MVFKATVFYIINLVIKESAQKRVRKTVEKWNYWPQKRKIDLNEELKREKWWKFYCSG